MIRRCLGRRRRLVNRKKRKIKKGTRKETSRDARGGWAEEEERKMKIRDE